LSAWSFEQLVDCSANNTGGLSRSIAQIGLGVNSTTAPTGLIANRHFIGGSLNAVDAQTVAFARYLTVPSLGINTTTSLEQVNTSGLGGSNELFGTEQT
jgi:hypothetical protein